MKKVWQKRYEIALLLVFLIVAVFRFNNAFKYNTYWGYDGGAHFEYSKVVLQEKRLPLWQDTYVAWHEPYYYVALAVVGQVMHYAAGGEYDFETYIVKFWQYIQAVIALAILWLVYLLSKKFSRDKRVHLAAVMSAGFLSVMTETSNYLTNELLLCFFVLMLFYLIISFGSRWNFKKAVLVGILCGSALLTKLSAIIFILALFLWLLYRGIYTRKFKWVWYGLIIVSISAALYVPWGMYKTENIGSLLSVNAYEARISEARVLPEGFFTRFDSNVISNPFWMSGEDSFASILYADIFSDYYLISSNVDRIDLKVGTDDKQLTGTGRDVLVFKFCLSVVLLVFSIGFAVLWILGFIGLLYTFVRNKCKPSVNLLVIIFIVGSFLAVAYNVWQFPYLERGTLKASFVLSVWPLLMIVGFAWLSPMLKKIKATFLWPIIWVFLSFWVVLSILIDWI